MSYYSHIRSKEEEEQLRTVHQLQLEDFPTSFPRPPLFENVHMPSATGYTPINTPYVPLNPSPTNYMSPASHNPTTGFLPASHNLSTANYMQSTSHNPSTPSYMSTPVNYSQHSSPVGYMPPTPARWLPNVVEQQGTFRYVKTNTPAPPQKPRPSTRGGSPGFLYPSASRLHGLPPKPTVGKWHKSTCFLTVVCWIEY